MATAPVLAAHPETRAALASAALRRAEEHTGASRWIRPARSTSSPAAQLDPEAGRRCLEVPSHLVPLLPSGGLDRGSIVAVVGSTSLALALVSEASRSGSWVALVGMPCVGVLAAQQLGLVLDRVALVPSPGADSPTVVAALLDGVDVVVLGPQAALLGGDRRRLSARARERSAVLVPTTAWPGAQVVLTAQMSRWEGLGRGHGRLRSQRLTVHLSGRGAAAQGRRDEVVLPGDHVGSEPTRSAGDRTPQGSPTAVGPVVGTSGIRRAG